MIEELKYSVFNLFENDLYQDFTIEKNRISFFYNNIIVVEVSNKEISVFYDSDVIEELKTNRYLNKINTLEIFHEVSPAINYLKYLFKVLKNIKYELYHYFLYKIKELKFNYDALQFCIVNNDTANPAIRCEISGLDLERKPLLYNFLFIVTNDGQCQLSFYPEKPLWNEGKVCLETEIDRILDYVKNLNVQHYDDIPLKEVDIA